MQGDPLDPKGLIREAYRIDGIGPGECRSIFLDWALSRDDGEITGQSIAQLIEQLIERHGAANPDHPMTAVLREGLTQADRPRRRGGWRSRPRDT